jgi:hypothetical protein
MYADAIKELRSMLDRAEYEHPRNAAILTAIALMRSAEPKSEGEEREYCMAAAKDTTPWVEAYAERIERERALARAESAVKLAAVKGKVAELRDMLGRAGAALEAHVPQHSINPLIAELLEVTK